MTSEPNLFPVFAVRIGEERIQVTAGDISSLIATASTPRPGQEFTVRDRPEVFAADVVYVKLPDAPAYRVTYGEIARAWAAIAQSVAGLDVGGARRVIARACQHLEPRS